MKTRRYLEAFLACTLGACALHGTGGGAAVHEAPPRLASGPAEPPGITGQLSLCGLAVVGNTGDLHFLMELSGDKVSVHKETPNDTYRVDGLKVQVTSILADEMAPTARGLTGIALLRMHARYESARLADIMGREAPPEEISVLTSDSMPAGLVWWLPGPPQAVAVESEGSDPQDQGYPAAPPAPPPFPATNDAASRVTNNPTGIAYMTAAYGQRVLVLSVQGMHGEPRSALVAKAQAWVGTVKTSPRFISAHQVRTEIDAARAAGQTCPGRPNAVLEP